MPYCVIDTMVKDAIINELKNKFPFHNINNMTYHAYHSYAITLHFGGLFVNLSNHEKDSEN